MPLLIRILYKLVYKDQIDVSIRSYHVYKEIWTSEKDGILHCKKDCCSEALDVDKHAVGLCNKSRLMEHVPIELSQIITYFLQENETNDKTVAVNGKRRRELSLVVPRERTVNILGD